MCRPTIRTFESNLHSAVNRKMCHQHNSGMGSLHSQTSCEFAMRSLTVGVLVIASYVNQTNISMTLANERIDVDSRIDDNIINIGCRVKCWA